MSRTRRILGWSLLTLWAVFSIDLVVTGLAHRNEYTVPVLTQDGSVVTIIAPKDPEITLLFCRENPPVLECYFKGADGKAGLTEIPYGDDK